MNLAKRFWISFAVVVIVGLALLFVIHTNAEKASISSRGLLSVALPKLNLIKELRTNITEHERLLYKYYASNNRKQVWPQIIQAEQILAQQLITINEHFARDVVSLPQLYTDVTDLQHELDINLSSANTNWDKARSDLVLLSLAGQKAEAILVKLTTEVELQAKEQAKNTQDRIENIVDLVVVYTIIILTIGLILGYYTQLIVRKTAKRKALAKFPERNPNPVMNLNWQGAILFYNPACELLLNNIYPDSTNLADILPKNFRQLLVEWQDDDESTVNFEDTINNHHLQYSLSLLQDLESCHLYIEDVTERKQAQAQLEYQALHDMHTGFPNRRKFETDLTYTIKLKQSCSILFVSIDRFKFITSSQGYHVGDDIIEHLGKRLFNISEELNCPIKNYRLEGCTFCLIIVHRNANKVVEVAKAIQNAMDDALFVNEHSYYLNVSMGYCHYPQDGDNTQRLISNGHAALNHARVIGNNFQAYNTQLHSAEQSWLPIERGIRQALELQQFVMYYQAKVDANTGKINGAEALIRWFKDDGAMVSPATFIPVAEQTGLIIQMGHWIIEQCFIQATAFYNQGHEIQVAINISARQFQYRNFVERLQVLIDKTGVNPKHIELEITESLIMENIDKSIAIMQQLKKMGFALAIDDFGTGYSSLSYLKKFPIDSLKIDQAFVKNIEEDQGDKNIVAAIIDLAQHFNLKTIAEGIETEGQWQLLKQMKCDDVQGFYFSKPNRADQLFL